jgi:hypothetical protein
MWSTGNGCDHANDFVRLEIDRDGDTDKVEAGGQFPGNQKTCTMADALLRRVSGNPVGLAVREEVGKFRAALAPGPNDRRIAPLGGYQIHLRTPVCHQVSANST